MLRFDYKENEDGTFNITVVSMKGDSHSLAGKLVLDAQEWKNLWTVCAEQDTPDTLNRKEKFYIFENKDGKNAIQKT